MLQLACKDNAQRDAWLDAIKVLLFQHFDPVPAEVDRPATSPAAPLLTSAAPMLSPAAPPLSKASAPGTGGHVPQLLAMLEHPLSPSALFFTQATFQLRSKLPSISMRARVHVRAVERSQFTPGAAFAPFIFRVPRAISADLAILTLGR